MGLSMLNMLNYIGSNHSLAEPRTFELATHHPAGQDLSILLYILYISHSL